MDSFDFDHWQALAQTDVESFVCARREALAQIIHGAAPERRAALQALQDEVETLRALNPGSDRVLATLVAMMTERLDALTDLKSRFDCAVVKIDLTETDRVRR